MPDFDENVRKALEEDETFQGILNQLKEAAKDTVRIRVSDPCPKFGNGCTCQHIRFVEVPDYKTKLQIIEFLANRGVGRPQQAEGETGERITFIREVRK